MYFVSHPQLFGAVRPVLYKSLVLSGVVVALMFLFTCAFPSPDQRDKRLTRSGQMYRRSL